MKIHKAQFTVTVYSEDPLPPDIDLPEILELMDDGPCIGSVAVGPVVVLTDPEQVREEMLAIGNDGAFFDDHLALLDEEED